MNEQIKDIAHHCLKCARPACQKACPAHVNIPAIMKALEEEDIKQATAILATSNVLPMLCSVLCDHEAQCEGHCINPNKIAISAVEKFLSEHLTTETISADLAKPTKRLAIVGGGVSGMCLCYLLRNYYQITIFEKAPELGGTVKFEIPDFRFDKLPWQTFIASVSKHPFVNLVLNTAIDDTNYTKLLAPFDYVIFTTGTMVNQDYGLNTTGLYQARDLLTAINAGSIPFINQKVIVLGLGNAAIDVARALAYHNNHVHIVYRRDVANANISFANRTALQDAGIAIHELLSPLSVERRAEQFELTLVKMQLVDANEGTRKNVVKTDETQTLLCDQIVIAFGSKYQPLPISKPEYNGTDYGCLENYFWAGDSWLGASNIASSMHSAIKLAEHLKELA